MITFLSIREIPAFFHYKEIIKQSRRMSRGEQGFLQNPCCFFTESACGGILVFAQVICYNNFSSEDMMK